MSVEEIEAWLEASGRWLLHLAGDGWLWVQLGLLAIIVGLALLLAQRLRPHCQRWLRPLKKRRRLARLADTLLALLRPLAVLALLWPAIGVLRQLTDPAHGYLLGVAASLLSAWVAVRLAAAFVRNAFLARVLAWGVWVVAALSITGLLGPTLGMLDSVAFSLGDFRLSLLALIKGVALMAALLWAVGALSRGLEARLDRIPDLTPSARVLLGKSLKIALVVLAVAATLGSIGVDLSALALFSGAVGVGVGFGLQKVVSNLVSGLILLLDKSIKPGDVIELGETFGWINALGARYVSVITRDGKEYLIPNEDLITQRVVNWSFSSDLVRLEVAFGVSYQSDPRLVRDLAVVAAAGCERVVPDNQPVCHLTGFGESSLDFVLRFWIHDPQNGVANVKGAVLLALWDVFKEHGIAIPYPHRQVLIETPVHIRSETP